MAYNPIAAIRRNGPRTVDPTPLSGGGATTARRTTIRPGDTYGQKVWKRFFIIPKERAIRKKELILNYASDWLITIGILAAFFFLDRVDGFKREFSLKDTSIQHTFAVHERVPNGLLIVIALVAPMVLMPLVNLLTVRSLWDWHNSSLGAFLALALTGSIIDAVKICVGRPRPDLIDRCQPQPGSVDAPVYGLSNHFICTRTDLLQDGFRSFPSGHSGLSFAGLGFLSFYLAGKLHLFDHRGYTGKAWISMTPLLGASLVAVSRTMDNRHHYQDVVVGSTLGLTIAYFCYRQYYPPLDSPISHEPYAPRLPDEDKQPLPTNNPVEPRAAPGEEQEDPFGDENA